MWQPLINSMKGSRAWNSCLITPKMTYQIMVCSFFVRLYTHCSQKDTELESLSSFLSMIKFSKSLEAAWFHCFQNYHDQQTTWNKYAVKQIVTRRNTGVSKGIESNQIEPSASKLEGFHCYSDTVQPCQFLLCSKQCIPSPRLWKKHLCKHIW